VNVEDFINGKRTRNVTDARRCFFHILKTSYEIPELQIAKIIPFTKERTTIMYSVDTAEDFLDYDYLFAFNYKKTYEDFFKVEFQRPLPVCRNKVEKKKPKSIYKFFTDDMIVRSKIPVNIKMTMLTYKYKEGIRDAFRRTVSMNQMMKEYSISKGLLKRILTELL
jgi:hypothetical protein